MDASVKSALKRKSVVGAPLPHDSAHLHVTGRASYTDDLPEPRDLLHVAVGMSTVAHAKVGKMDFTDVFAAPGVVDGVGGGLAGMEAMAGRSRTKNKKAPG